MLKNILPVTIFDTKLIVRNVALYMDQNLLFSKLWNLTHSDLFG